MASGAKTKKRSRPKYLVDDRGRRTGVLLTIGEYDELMQAAEDLADLQAAHEARAEGGESLPWEKVKAGWRAKRKRA